MNGEPMTTATITIRAGISADGDLMVGVDLPAVEDASLVEVLGLLEFAKAAAIQRREGPGAR